MKARFAFTGPVELSAAGAAVVRRAVGRLEGAECFISGAAHGVDTAAAFAALDCFPSVLHRVYVPAAWHNRDAVAELRERGAEIVQVGGGASAAESYMARNDRMVGDCTDLVGFPLTLDEELRSGTWATIRRARRVGRRVSLHPLGGMEAKVVHCCREDYDVYIGRGRDPRTNKRGEWGNPFSHRRSRVLGVTVVGSREEAIGRYRGYLWHEIQAGRISLEQLAALHGKVLGCWCAPESCHGEVLARAAQWAWEMLRAR